MVIILTSSIVIFFFCGYMKNYILYALVAAIIFWAGASIEKYLHRLKLSRIQTLSLTNDKLILKKNDREITEVAYKDLAISNVRKIGGNIESINMEFHGVNAIEIRDYKDMQGIYAILSEKVQRKTF